MFRVGFAGTETKNQTDLKVWSRDKRPSRARRRERQARLGENKQRHSHAGWSVITISLVGNFVVESILKSDTDVHTEPDRNWKESVNCLTSPGPALSLGTFGESFVDQAPLGLALPAAHWKKLFFCWDKVDYDECFKLIQMTAYISLKVTWQKKSLLVASSDESCLDSRCKNAILIEITYSVKV